MSSVQPIATDEARWERIVQLTGGAANVCRNCGDCTVTCRWGLFESEGPNMWALLSNATRGQEADPQLESALWDCATCGACQTVCPKGVHTADIIVGLRSLAYTEGRHPPILDEILGSLELSGNPDGFPRSLRRRWAKDLDSTPMGSNGCCLVYFGSATSFSPRLQRIGRAFACVLGACDVGYGVFDEEPDSGAVARMLGADKYLEKLVEVNLDTLHECGIHEIVATSPHDYDVFQRIYPRYGDTFRVFHATEYLDQLIQYDRLRFEFAPDEPRRVAYHDPCYLGRHHGVYEPPRRVLQEMSGVELVEFEEKREDAACCGGGGGRPWLEENACDGFADERIAEAMDLGADLIVTPCPYCIQMFEESIDKLGASRLEVRDVVELAAAWWPYAPQEEDLTFGTSSIA